MKKVLFGILTAVYFIGGFMAVGYYDSHYTKECDVVRTVDNVIILEDKQGNIWECEGFTDKTSVQVSFFDNHTQAIEDDIIVGFH